ncbi:ribbon-helix-helix protein, CopG family [Exiguobacterium sp. UBA1053]|uniref:ribbon-helix-helix protein, CopG family n=1 Tax=Exiguobacterium sp. UBA1053 TaxID=1946487 RepID=UPI0039C85688
MSEGKNRLRKRVNFTLSDETLAKMDEIVDAHGSNRSKLIDIAVANVYIRHQKGLPLKSEINDELR